MFKLKISSMVEIFWLDQGYSGFIHDTQYITDIPGLHGDTTHSSQILSTTKSL